MLDTILAALQAIVSILLIASILLQQRSSGFGAAIGGAAGATFTQRRRGAEKVIFQATVWLTVIFCGLAVAQWYV